MILALLLTIAAHAADGRVEEILTARDLRMSAVSPEDCTPGQIFVIYGQSDKREIADNTAEPIGYADIYARFGEKGCLAKVKSHSQSALIRVHDPAVAIDMKSGKTEVPGRNDLIREGHKEYAAFYKATVYGGYLFGQTASTLDKGEFLVGLTPLMYGLTNNVQLDLTYFQLLKSVVQGGAKYRFVSNEDMPGCLLPEFPLLENWQRRVAHRDPLRFDLERTHNHPHQAALCFKTARRPDPLRQRERERQLPRAFHGYRMGTEQLEPNSARPQVRGRQRLRSRLATLFSLCGEKLSRRDQPERELRAPD